MNFKLRFLAIDRPGRRRCTLSKFIGKVDYWTINIGEILLTSNQMSVEEKRSEYSLVCVIENDDKLGSLYNIMRS